MQATIFGSMQMKRTFLDNMEVKKAHFDSPESQGLLSHKAQLKSMAMPNIMGAGIVPSRMNQNVIIDGLQVKLNKFAFRTLVL